MYGPTEISVDEPCYAMGYTEAYRFVEEHGTEYKMPSGGWRVWLHRLPEDHPLHVQPTQSHRFYGSTLWDARQEAASWLSRTSGRYGG